MSEFIKRILFVSLYRGDHWQAKIVTGLHEFLAKHPEELAAAKDCPAKASFS